MNGTNTNDEKFIVAIDPGIVHLGVAWCKINEGVPWCEGAACVNLKEACDPKSHVAVSYALCALHHSKHLHDRISHFFQEWGAMLHKADMILVERQPFTSAGYPFELLIREKFGPKCSFVAPQTLLAYFGTAKMSYDDRKVRNEQVAEKWLIQIGCEPLWEAITKERRQHDCADAILLVIHHLGASGPSPPSFAKRNHSTLIRPIKPLDEPSISSDEIREDQDGPTVDFHSFIEKFRYTGGQ